MARNSNLRLIRNTLGRTNHDQTPLVAILFSFLPGLVAFTSVRYQSAVFREVRILVVPQRHPANEMETLANPYPWQTVYWSGPLHICQRMSRLSQISKRVRNIILDVNKINGW